MPQVQGILGLKSQALALREPGADREGKIGRKQAFPRVSRATAWGDIGAQRRSPELSQGRVGEHFQEGVISKRSVAGK